ncbi:MAG: mechanosensitive ion channel family protein [Candidatus Krumholzibacteriia bacterium]
MTGFLAQASAQADTAAALDVTSGDFWIGLLDILKEKGPELGLKILGALVIFWVGRLIAGSIRKALRTIMDKRRVDASLTGFVTSLVYFAILAFTVVAVIGQFGVETASFIAILGAAGFAVGMALQGTLGNFASGVMLLLFRPFKPGDFIEAAGVTGTVKEIQIFSTTLATPDNIRITVPNGALFGGTIKNYNGYDQRRVDMTMGIAYDSDIDLAMKIINEILEADGRILAEPARTVAVAQLADSSVNIVVRPWVNAADYWSVLFDFHKNCKQAFDAAGIEIPFPQRVVHMVNSAS